MLIKIYINKLILESFYLIIRLGFIEGKIYLVMGGLDKFIRIMF